MIWSAAGWSCGMADLGLLCWCWIRLYFFLYALTISVVKLCQLPLREDCVQKELRSAGSLGGS